MNDAPTLPASPCSVVDCPNPGRPQACPFDGKYHHHGRVHYSNDMATRAGIAAAGLGIRFVEPGEGWRYTCDRHIADLEHALGARVTR